MEMYLFFFYATKVYFETFAAQRSYIFRIVNLCCSTESIQLWSLDKLHLWIKYDQLLLLDCLRLEE